MVLNTGQVVAGRYEIIEKIGAGGTSIVYRAKDIKLDRFVTFKVLREEHLENEDFKKRFKVEARAIASLNHPNIVNVYDVGNEADINYIVMEYIDGVTLKELIIKRAPFDNEEVTGVTVQVAAALSHAHKNGIIHRDIKPQNILVTPNGTVKVADFGIARYANSATIASTGSTMGSVHYISPEQARGEATDARSDLYSLGIVMYEMFTGELPFDANSPVSVALMHINDPFPDIRQLNTGVFKSISGIINALTEKDPNLRYQSSERLSSDLKSALIKPDKRIDLFRPSPFTEKGDRNERGGSSESAEKRDLEFIFNKRQRQRGEVFIDDEDGDDIALSRYDSYNPTDSREEKALERKVILAAVLSGVAIIALLAVFLLPMLGARGGDKVDVPQLIGMDYDAGLALVTQLGLTLNREIEEYNEEYDAGVIFLQDYESGKPVDAGTTISVAVSLGTPKLDVPDFTGKDLSAVAATRTPFTIVEYAYEYSDTVPINSIISQIPEAGEQLEAGSEVLLTISKGVELKKVIVPDVVSLTEADGRSKLSDMGLVVGQVTETYSTKYAKGLIVAHTPGGGREVLAGSSIVLQISSGPPPETPKPPDSPSETPDGGQPGQPEQTGPVTVNLTFSPYIDEGIETVTFTLVKKTPGGMVEVYSKEHAAADFPLTVPVTDEGVIEYHMLINGITRGSKTVDFSNPLAEENAQ